MNLHGSYRKLLEHSKQAIIAAIEIYNKPKINYREEIFSILITNAWDIIILAILSKNKIRIFEPKRRCHPYRTLGFEESIKKVKSLLPGDVSPNAVVENIAMIRKYRNSALHYYQKSILQNKQAIYALGHASILNYRDILLKLFGQDIADEVNIVLLPLSFGPSPNFIEFLRKEKVENYSPYVREILGRMGRLEDDNADQNRLITRCAIKFERTKNTNIADIIASKSGVEGATIVDRPINPDDSHPHFQNDIIGGPNKKKHKRLRRKMNSNDFQAVIWKNKIRENPVYCWSSRKGGSPRYSEAIFNFLNGISEEEMAVAKTEYNSRRRRSSNR